MPRSILPCWLCVALLSLLWVGIVPTASAQAFEQDFMITAYYSPLPDQCCYVTGSYESDKVLNGNGTNGADGTEVYPGMAAAPKTYAFGTRITLPGIGVVTVHDRGGAIVEQENTHRLDLWVGAGEEGLARALAFGVRRVKGTVHPVGFDQPAEAIDFAKLESPLDTLKRFVVDTLHLSDATPKADDRTLAVRLLQEQLQTIGYFAQQPTGFFGPVTRASLLAFLKDFGLEENADTVSERAAAFLTAALSRKDAKPPVDGFVDANAPRKTIAQAQRILRFLGYYRGRTNGIYDHTLAGAIVAFQKDRQLIGNEQSPGAGRIGPLTLGQLTKVWNTKLVAMRAERVLELGKVDTLIAEQNVVPTKFLEIGDSGEEVKKLQTILAAIGYFPKERISGTFGHVTRTAVLQFQIDNALIPNDKDKAAGFVGPATLMQLKTAQREQYMKVVKAEGWEAL